MGRNRSWVVRITTAECAVELRCSAGGFCCVDGWILLKLENILQVNESP